MTEKAVVNVRSEISENGHDQHEVKDGCNGVAHATENEVEVRAVNGDVGGKINGDAAGDFVGGSDAVGAGASDLVAVIDDDGGGAASEGVDLKHEVDADGESHVTVLEVPEVEDEGKCEAIDNGSAEDEIREKEISNGAVPVDSAEQCADGENDSGSVTVSDVSGDKDVTEITVVEGGAKDLNKIQGHEIESVVVGEDVQNGVADRELSERAVENEIHGDANGVIISDVTKINDQDAVDVQNGVENEICDDLNGVQEGESVAVAAEVLGDEKDVVEGVADENKNHGEFESVAVQNGLAVESEVPVVVDDGVSTADVEECAAEGDQTGSGEEAQIESVDSGAGDEKDGGSVVQERSEPISDTDVDRSLQSENIASADVSDEKEKDVVTTESQDGESESVVDADVQNRLADTKPSECAEENAISVDVDGVSATTDVKECEDDQNGLEKAQIESVTDTDVEKSIVGADVQNGLAEPELSECTDEKEVLVEGEPGSKLESSEETRHELVSEGENLSALNSTDVSRGADVISDANDNAVESEGKPSVDMSGMKNIAMESEGEPSDIAVGSEGEPSNNAVEREGEPSNNAGESEGDSSNIAVESEPSNNAVEREADSSNNAVEREAEPSNNAGCEGEPSNIAVESEAEPSNNAVEREADSSNNAVLSEAEPSNNAGESEAEPSNNAGESEAEPCANISEMRNNAVESETEPSVENELSVEGEGGNDGEGDSKPTQQGSISDTLDGQNVGSEVVKRPFYYLIRLPRYDDDENIKEQIENAQRQVEEKTKIRDAIRAESQAKKAIFHEYRQDFRDAATAERAARDLLKSKRQEMDSVQSIMNRLNNAISVGDIDGKIRNMEHMIQHETLPLKEEKQLIRQIKQLKQNREELSSTIAKQDQSQQSIDQKDSIEDHFKRLQLFKKEVELLRNNLLKAEAATKAARKKCDDESNKLSELRDRFNDADNIRQEAYAKLHALKNQLHEKSKYFWEYKNAATKGKELAAEGKKEELQCFCVDQVERIMELWNKSDQFRRDYTRCNTRSTLRRLQTLDGRSLGPDEEPPVIPNTLIERASKSNSLILQSTPEQEMKPASTEPVNIKDEPVSKVVVQRSEKSQTSIAKKSAKPATSEKSLVAVSRWADEPEDTIEEPVRTKEEEELILKAEKARKEEEEAKLKEKRRLEEIEKAKEAMQRKRRNAEKAQQKAALRAQKEAEQKEKEREKKARKKERRKATSSDIAENTEQESAPISETLTRSIEEIDQSEKPVEVTKRPQKPSQFTRQTKPKSVPLPLRNRGKRRIQPWMWAIIAVLVVVTLFYMGNSSFLRSWLQGSGF